MTTKPFFISFLKSFSQSEDWGILRSAKGNDVIYEPYQTEFSEAGNIKGNIFENGLNMFLFQAQKAFKIWHKIEPEINEEVEKFLKS